MKIRPATKDDVSRIVKLIGDIWAEYDCVLDTEKEEQYLLDPDGYFHARNGEFWVVEQESEIAATVAVMTNDKNTAELKSLYVHKEFRQKGLGEKLTNLAIDFCRGKGAKIIILWSDTRFIKAHRLYERLGFEPFDKRELDDLNNSIEYGFSLEL